MKCGKIRMLWLDIKLDQIRPRREYWRLLGNHELQLFYFIWKFKVSVCLLYRFLAVVQLMNKISFFKSDIFYSEVEFKDSR